jgi:hypothetical protein
MFSQLNVSLKRPPPTAAAARPTSRQEVQQQFDQLIFTNLKQLSMKY